MTGNRSATSSKECVVFRSTLQNVPKESTGILLAEWNSSRLPETAGEHASFLSLPEPGTGTLLSIGLFALIEAAIRKRRSRTVAGSLATHTVH